MCSNFITFHLKSNLHWNFFVATEKKSSDPPYTKCPAGDNILNWALFWLCSESLHMKHRHFRGLGAKVYILIFLTCAHKVLIFFPRIHSFFANDSSWLIFGFACVGYSQEWVECYTRRWDGIWLTHKPFQQKSTFFFSSVWKMNTVCIGLICVWNCPNELPRFPCVFGFPHSFPLTN